MNDAKTVQEAFQDYYEVTGLSEVTNPNILYELQYELETVQVYD